MKQNTIIGGLVMVLGLGAAVSIARSDEDHKHQPQMSDAEKAMTDAWQKASTPGPQHASFKNLVGKWKTETKMWHGFGDPEVSYGMSTFKLILGGRFIEENFASESMGVPFKGRGTLGYDNVKKKYIGSWIDTMGTGMTTSEGSYDTTTKTKTMSGLMLDPFGKEMKFRYTIKEINPNKSIMEMYMIEAGGKEMKNMEIVYTRM